MKIDESSIFEKDLSYNLYFEIFFGFWRFLSRSNMTGNPGQLWRNTKQFQWQHHTYKFDFFFWSGGAKLFDSPFYDYFFLIPSFQSIIFTRSPRFHHPPCKLKNGNSLIKEGVYIMDGRVTQYI